jgi:hypothetical protein
MCTFPYLWEDALAGLVGFNDDMAAKLGGVQPKSLIKG